MDLNATEKAKTASTSIVTSEDCPLHQLVSRSYILAYKEDVAPLFSALAAEKLNPEVLRASYSEAELQRSPMMRTFFSHFGAWQRAAQQDGYTLILEADFVPCVGLGDFPSFWPLSDPLAFGYLYVGSPRILALIGEKPYLRVHSSPLVAYVVNAAVARVLCEFFEDQVERHGSQAYLPFDSHLQWFATGKGAGAFMPMKSYGEHGGRPNPEHSLYGLPRAGQHRADNLMGRLHFLPQYCRGSIVRYTAARMHARLLGIGRLLSNKWLTRTNVYPYDLVSKLRMYVVGFRRLLL